MIKFLNKTFLLRLELLKHEPQLLSEQIDRREVVIMNQKKTIQNINKVRETSQKRNFSQTFDLIINLKDLNLKKVEEQVESFANLHYNKGRKVKVCALVGPELATNAKENCDFIISQEEFDKYAKDKKLTKNLVKDYEFFVAQASIMPK